MAKALSLPSPEARAVALVVFDFDGVFTDNTVWTNQIGEETVRCFRSDGLGLSRLQAAGVKVIVLSTEMNPVVAARCAKLKLPVRQSLADKAQALREIMVADQLTTGVVAYVGNDVNDLDCLRAVGVPIVVADAYPEAVAVAQFQTTRAGGCGAVREVCDWIVASKTAV